MNSEHGESQLCGIKVIEKGQDGAVEESGVLVSVRRIFRRPAE